VIGGSFGRFLVSPMPSLTKLARVVCIVTLPKTRGVIVAAARSAALRDVARRAVNDRAALVRDLRNPENARDFLRSAARHPAVRELAGAGLMFLPGRYLPVGWAATWAAHRVLRRYTDPPTEVQDASPFGTSGRLTKVTPELARRDARQPSVRNGGGPLHGPR
jgi:hypothetical protein